MGLGMVWPYGAEHWCNLEGQYLHIVADLNELYATESSYEMSICTLGVFGTQYVRSGGDAVPSLIEIKQGETLQISIQHITSAL